MAIKLETGSPGVGLREGYSQTIDPSSFVRSYDSSIRAGQQLQNFGGQLGDLAVAEQKVYNSTQVNSAKAARTLAFAKHKEMLLQPENFNPHTYEQDLLGGLGKINTNLEKKQNPRAKSLIAADGLDFVATQTGIVKKEARVFRVKALKATGLESLRALRQEHINLPDTPSNAVLKQQIDDTMLAMITDMVDGNILSPEDGNKERIDILSIREYAKLAELIDGVTSRKQVNQILDKVQYQDEKDVAILKIRGFQNAEANKRANVATADREARLARQVKEDKQEAKGADLDGRIFDPNTQKPVTLKELRQLRDDGEITRNYFDKRVEQINSGVVFTNRPTVPEELDKIHKLVERQIQNPTETIIKPSDIQDNESLSNEDRNIFKQRLLGADRSAADSEVSTLRKRLRQGLSVDTLLRMNKRNMARKKLAKIHEFDRLTDKRQKGDPSKALEIYNRMIAEELNINDPTHPLSQIEVKDGLDKIPDNIRTTIKSDTGLIVPHISEMAKKANQLHESKKISDDDLYQITDELEELGTIWDQKAIEKHGNIKSAKKVSEEKKEEDKKQVKEKEKQPVVTGTKPIPTIESTQFSPSKVTPREETTLPSESGAPAMWELAQSLGLNPEILKNAEYFPDQFIFEKWSELLERELTEEEKPIFKLLMDEVGRRGING